MAKKRTIKKIERDGILAVYATALLICCALIFSSMEYWTIFYCIVGVLAAVLTAVICPRFNKTYGFTIAFYSLVISTVVILEQINASKEGIPTLSLVAGVPLTMAVICGGQLVMQIIAVTILGAILKEKK